MAIITEKTLINFCEQVSGFCGREDVIHEILCAALSQSGVPIKHIAREQKCPPIKRCDIVVFGDEVPDKYTTNEVPVCAIEVKGGAYGYRNSLSELYRKFTSSNKGTEGSEIDREERTIDDIKNLSECAKQGIEAWFICIDMPDLGVSFNEKAVQEVLELCRQQGINFLYYCQREKEAVLLKDGTVKRLQVTGASHKGVNKSFESIISSATPADIDSMLHTNGHEANLTSCLYRMARDNGFSVPQTSLETYFVAAATGTRGGYHRPDMVLFDKKFDGRFNLYEDGNMKSNLDSHKMPKVRSLIEVKGGSSFRNATKKVRMEKCLADADKLSLWKKIFGKSPNVELVFIVADSLTKPLGTSDIGQICAAMPKDSLLAYLGPNENIIRRI